MHMTILKVVVIRLEYRNIHIHLIVRRNVGTGLRYSAGRYSIIQVESVACDACSVRIVDPHTHRLRSQQHREGLFVVVAVVVENQVCQFQLYTFSLHTQPICVVAVVPLFVVVAVCVS
jgi:hypothetical protein